MEHQTLYFDTEKSGESYIHLYADEPGVPAGQSLWPAPIPVVGVSGAIGQGKTTFLLDIANGPVRRIDVPLEMMKLKPNGYRPIDTFTWFWNLVRTIPAGKFRVIALDVAEEIEQGVAEWVWENPLHFNTTRQQFIKMSGVYQGLVSSFWKSILMDITSRCETFAFANHIGQVFDGGGKAVAGKTKSKGRPVMKQSATLYVNLHREKDAAGNLSDRPAGVVDLSEGGKTRLMTKVTRGGVRVKVPVLPPRIPIATPQAIRDYFVNPPDYSALTTQQRSPEKVVTADDRIEAQTELARQQAEVERLKIERISEERKASAAATSTEHAEAGTDILFDTEPPVAAAEPSMTVNPPAPETETPTSEPESVAAPPAVETPAVETPAVETPAAESERTKPARNGRAKLPQGAIVDWLKDQPAAVLFADLAAAMHLAYGVDSNKVHLAAKSLRDAGTVKVVQVGDAAWIGLPAAKFPSGDRGTEPPAATQPTDTQPTDTYRRPASLPNDLRDSVKQLWHEFAIVGHAWPHDQADATWKAAVLDRYGVFTGNELTEPQLGEIERNLVKKINDLYAAKGVPLASPFCADLSNAAA